MATTPRRPAKKTMTYKRGSALARAIEERANELGLSQKLTAEQLGFSEAYYTLLLSGQRWFGSVDEEKLRNISEFLDLPFAAVYMLAEVIQPKDFYRASTVEKQVDAAFKVMARDKRFIPAMPNQEQWNETPLEVRLLCAILYQDVSGKDLLEKATLVKVGGPKDN